MKRALLLLLLLAGALRADEQRGIVLTRQAQSALAAGDAEGALALLEQARVEWPGSAIVASTLGDAHRALGHYPEAISEYERGRRDGCEHHTDFNSGVARNEQAEAALAAAGVPPDVASLPEGSQPGMLTAIRDALGTLVSARKNFLDALDQVDDHAGRESVGALNRRIDALREMEAELKQREQEDKDRQKDQNQDQEQDQDKEQQDPKDKDDAKQGGQDEPKDGQSPQQPRDAQDQDQPRDAQDGQDQPPPDDESQPSGEGEQAPDQGADKDGSPAPQARELSKEEVQQLLDRLEQLEKEGRLLQKDVQRARHRAVEKDW